VAVGVEENALDPVVAAMGPVMAVVAAVVVAGPEPVVAHPGQPRPAPLQYLANLNF